MAFKDKVALEAASETAIETSFHLFIDVYPFMQPNTQADKTVK